VAADLFLNPGGATLANGTGGAWRVWSRTWTGSDRGGLAGDGPAGNLYGCSFGDTAACSLSGAAIPASGNRFFYVERPAVTVTAGSLAMRFGDAVPSPLPFTAAGLVNGDPMVQVLTGAPSTLATSASPPGAYSIDAGTLAVSTGYTLAYVPGVLDVTAPPNVIDGLERELGLAVFLSSQRSEVYGRNLSLPYMCAAPSALRREREQESAGATPLSVEWTRVRSQPQLSSCLNLRDAADCAAF
jgi:hypothetical protein